MSHHEKESSSDKGGHFVDHEEAVANEGEAESNHDEAGHEMISGWVFRADVVDHEHDGKRFKHLEVVYAEAFTDDFEEYGY